MDLISAYSGEVSDGEETASDTFRAPQALVNTAPEVDASAFALVDNRAVAASSVQHLQAATARKTYYNLPVEQLHAPIVGPSHPYTKDGVAAGFKNHRSGYVEDAHLSDFHFDDQYNTFHSYGYAAAPQGATVVGDQESFEQRQGSTVFSGSQPKRRKTEAPQEPPAAAEGWIPSSRGSCRRGSRGRTRRSRPPS
jgi:pre-mRNA-processing factor 17